MKQYSEYLRGQLTRRQALRAGGLTALGLVFSKPVIETIRPSPVFAQYNGGHGTKPPTPLQEIDMAGIAFVNDVVAPISTLGNITAISVDLPNPGVLLLQANGDVDPKGSGGSVKIGIAPDSNSLGVFVHEPFTVSLGDLTYFVSWVTPASAGVHTFYLNGQHSDPTQDVIVHNQTLVAIFIENSIKA